MEKANKEASGLRVERDDGLAQVEKAHQESEDLRAALEEARKALELEQKRREEAQNLTKLEREGREEAIESIKELQSQLAVEKDKLSTAFHQHEPTGLRVAEGDQRSKGLLSFH